MLNRLKSGNWGRRVRRSVAAITVVGVAGMPPNQPSLHPPTVGGYNEEHGFTLRNMFKAFYDEAAQNRGRYLEDKKELEGEIAACGMAHASCHPRVREFAAMLEAVRKIPNKLTQVEIVNAWVNIKIAYDLKEPILSSTNDDHRTLSNALKDSKAVCDEIARLKLFGLEKLGFAPDDIRWVAEDLYVDGRLQKHGHAVTVVRIGNKIWAMNLMPADMPRSISPAGEIDLAMTASRLESSATQLNFSRQSDWSKACYLYLPTYQFNAAQDASYDSAEPLGDLSNVPASARRAVKETVALSAKDFQNLPLMAIMASAFSAHYKITDAKTAKKENAKRPPVVIPKELAPSCAGAPSYGPHSALSISPMASPGATMRFNADDTNLPLFQMPILYNMPKSIGADAVPLPAMRSDPRLTLSIR